MPGEKYKCTCCEYESLKKYNLYRHMVTKHIDSTQQNSHLLQQNSQISQQNSQISQQNSQNPQQNSQNPQQNSQIINETNNDNICSKCNKKLASKQSLNRHIKICKGVKNPYTCHLCNKEFAHYNSKYKHLKKCKGISNELIKLEDQKLELSPLSEVQNITEIQQNINELTVNNNNKIENSYNNNNNTYNINLIIYDKENDKIDFDISHMNNNFLYKLTSRNETDAFKYYCEKLFENKNNQMIIKSNLKNKYAKIHIGSNIWENFIDQHIYPKMMSIISETMLLYINKNKRNNNEIKYLDTYLQIMASEGYSNSDSVEYKKKYKTNIEMLKILFNSFM